MYEPAAHSVHPASSLPAPVTFPYRPAPHSSHFTPSLEYLPALHSSHAPVAAFFISPATHGRSSTTQYDAPVPSPVTPVVVQPSGHSSHAFIDVMIGSVNESLPHFAQLEVPL